MTPSLVLSGKGQGTIGARLLTSDHRRPSSVFVNVNANEPPPSTLPPLASRLPPNSGFALVATLLMITVITGAAVAFFQSTRIERFVSRNYADLARAQMAAESGAMLAGALLRSATANDHFIVYANTNRQLFIGNWANQGADNFLYLPLYSAGTNLASSGTNLAFITNSAPSRAPMGTTFTSVLNFAGGYAVTSPAISWIYLTNAQGRTNARFAFWTEDLAGRVNLSVAGASSLETNEPRRLTGTNPAELAVWTLFNPTSRSYLQAANGLAIMRNLADQRSALITAASARLANSNVSNSHLPVLCAGLMQDTNEPQVIPYGYGFPDAGLPKHNIVGVVAAGTNTSVNELRNIISRNLPGLTNRAGGLRLTPSDSVTYLNNLAANIVDFIDADTRVTAGPNYRGVEPLPYLNERATRYFRVQSPNPSNAIVETTEFMEFWNLHDRETAQTNVTVLYTNMQPMNWGNIRPLGLVTNFSINLPAIPPNGFYVASSPTFRTTLAYSGLGVPSGNLTMAADSTNVIYGIQYQGTLYDRGVCGNISEVTLSNNRTYFSSGYPALGAKFPIGSTAGNTYYSTHGDPRGSFYMTNPQHQVSYGRNASFGGRNRQGGNPNRANSEVNIIYWPDTGHNDVAGNPPSSDTTPPPTGVFFSQTNMAPARSNPQPGGLASICDLGSVFDPIQWAEVTANLAYNNDPSPGGTWTNLTSTAVPSSTNAGGTTLRIGRPEWRRFAFSGAGGRPTNISESCVGLLEIFAAGPTNNGAIVNPIQGRINLNTASPQALAVLAAGVNHVRDPSLVEIQGGTQITTGTNFYVPNHKVNDFANAVASYRSQRPFYSSGELNFLTYTNHTTSTAWPGNAVFHSSRMGFVNNSIGDTRWTDAAAEEWFQRIYSHSTVRSRNFMIYVIGQAMTTNTNSGTRPLATSQQAFQVYLSPQRAASNGLATNSSLQILGKWSL